MGGQAPFQNDAAQADPSCTTEHAQETDGARPLRNLRFVQRTHGSQIERRQDDGESDAPKDGKGHEHP